MSRLISLSRAPLTRSQLIYMPWCGGLVGAMISGFYWKYLSPGNQLLLAVCLGSLMWVLAGWIAYRSDFATRHGLVAPLLMLILLVSMSSGGAVLTLNMAGALAWRGWAALSVGGSLVLVFAGAAFRQWRQLQRQGWDGPWVREHVDAVAGRIRADALLSGHGDQTRWSPWFIGAVACNVPLLYHSAGVSDLQAMPIIMLVLLGAGVWICAGHTGPAAGKALFLLGWERQAGRTLVQEGWDDMQALRRSYWLSRWLMVKEPVPPATVAPRLTRTQRRRGGRQA